MINLRISIRNVLRGAVGITLTLPAVWPAFAQTPVPAMTLIEEVRVTATGSYIEGAAVDTALPIQVVGRSDWAEQGSPTIVDLAKSVSAVQGIIGESNQFTSAQTSGASNFNLRGLGAVRTLVLLNGRRLPPSPALNLSVDTALIPLSAIGRIEILKDGAAATYGSDAVAGVVNFVSRAGFDGVSIDASYSAIEDSDGDYETNFAWGSVSDTYDTLVTAGYRHRSELRTVDRGFAIRPFNEAPQNGFSSFGNPGVFRIPNPPGAAVPTTPFLDPGCANLGGLPGVNQLAPGQPPQCTFQFALFDNLVEREEHYHVYSELNTQLGKLGDLHLEAYYAGHETPEENSSPSFAPAQGPGETLMNATNAPNFIIPLSNPGLQALLPSLPADQQMAILGARAVVGSGLEFRPLGLGGNPLTGEGKKDDRRFDQYRVSAGLKGGFGGIGWDFALTYAQSTRRVSTPDIVPAFLQRALAGFGGTNCTSVNPMDAGNAAVGCGFFNPFSTGVNRNPITGQQNMPAGMGGTFVPGTANSADVVRGIFGSFGIKDQTSLFVADLVLDGELGIALKAGNIGYAVGAQYREDGLERDANNISNIAINPCADTPLTGNTNCTTRAGALGFFGGAQEIDLSDDVYGVFGELSLPLLESLQVQLAFRYEDYGGQVGSTSNPKLALRFQPLSWLGFRASVSSTFRGPVQNQLFDGAVTTLQFSPLAGGFRPVDTLANPALNPEEADNLNFGIFVEAGGFRGSIDYFQIKLEDPIIAENGADVLGAFFGTPQPGIPPVNNCGRPGFEALQARFTFANNMCAPNTVLRTIALNVNGPEERVKAVDVAAQYRFDNVLRGALTFGVDATYNIEYERDNLLIEGIQVPGVGIGRDFVGTRGAIQTLAELRGSVFADYSASTHNVRVTSRYIDGVDDIRFRAEVGSFLTYDLAYQLSLNGGSTLTAAVFNLTDEDPPFVNAELNYEQSFGNPIGRFFKVAYAKKF
jgi:iron complex outermembrane receptor protein